MAERVKPIMAKEPKEMKARGREGKEKPKEMKKEEKMMKGKK